MILVKHNFFIALIGLLLTFTALNGCNNTNLKVDAPPADPNDVKKTKFEGEWTKERQKLLFAGNEWTQQTITSGSFKNTAKGSFRYNDTRMRLIVDYTWNNSNNTWAEYPLSDQIKVTDCEYTLEGTTLTISNADDDVSMNGVWIFY